MYMNKYDFKVIAITLLIAILSFLVLKTRESSYAYVYYDNNLIKTIDLRVNKEYIVNGFNGDVKIVVNDNKLKVEEENSPLHICSKQGYMNKGTIVCLPNKIVINFNDELDARIGWLYGQ